MNCTFTSVWDCGSIITTPCVYNEKTGEVTPEIFKGPIITGNLEREYITLPDGEEIAVCPECHSYVMKGVINPGQTRHDLVEDSECSDPDCVCD